MRRSRSKAEPIHANHIIPRSKHRLSKSDISENALKVVNRLVSAGFQAYIVGGGVRDLLLGHSPKDFDVATNATPHQIRNLFRNARIIGRRFKIVHVVFHREIIEVATFRGSDQDANKLTNEQGMLIRDNVFGTLEEDAWRRDFTMNSLYYNVVDASIVDYTGGVKHIHDKTINMIGDATLRYQEDPVRMLRAIRFSAKLDFKIADATSKPIYELASLIDPISHSRLFDEMTKMYQCGASHAAQALLEEYGLFARLFPLVDFCYDHSPHQKTLINLGLKNTDARIKDNKTVNPAFIFAVLLWYPLQYFSKMAIDEGVLPLEALEKSMSYVLSEQVKKVNIPKRFTQIIREIWILQYRFPKRAGNRAYNVLNHPRFRAAYDFLVLRTQAENESPELINWWTQFQNASETQQAQMVQEINESAKPLKKKRRRRKPKKTGE